jgi:hypothetical protein
VTLPSVPELPESESESAEELVFLSLVIWERLLFAFHFRIPSLWLRGLETENREIESPALVYLPLVPSRHSLLSLLYEVLAIVRCSGVVTIRCAKKLVPKRYPRQLLHVPVMDVDQWMWMRMCT